MMEIIIIAAHGSPSKEAGDIEGITESLHRMIHPQCDKNCVRAGYLQFNKPSITEAINEAVNDGAKKIIIHPLFLSGGVHVTKSIPRIIKSAEDIYSDVKFIYTEPLGTHDNLVQIVFEKIKTAREKYE